MARDDARRIVLEVADMWDRLAASAAKENEPPSKLTHYPISRWSRADVVRGAPAGARHLLWMPAD